MAALPVMCECRGLCEPQEPRRVVFHDARQHLGLEADLLRRLQPLLGANQREVRAEQHLVLQRTVGVLDDLRLEPEVLDRKSTRLNSSHSQISYAVFCLKKKK